MVDRWAGDQAPGDGSAAYGNYGGQGGWNWGPMSGDGTQWMWGAVPMDASYWQQQGWGEGFSGTGGPEQWQEEVREAPEEIAEGKEEEDTEAEQKLDEAAWPEMGSAPVGKKKKQGGAHRSTGNYSSIDYSAFPDVPAEEEHHGHKGKGGKGGGKDRGDRDRGKGGDQRPRERRDDRDRGDERDRRDDRDRPRRERQDRLPPEPWLLSEGPTPEELEGEWMDSLGNTVTVEAGHRRRGPLSVWLVREEREKNLSLRCDPMTGIWVCGNAVLDAAASHPSTGIVWSCPDGRRSMWRRKPGESGAAPSDGADDRTAEPVDLMPWLLVPCSEAPEESAPAPSSRRKSVPKQKAQDPRRRRWDSIVDGDDDDDENMFGPGSMLPDTVEEAEEKAEGMVDTESKEEKKEEKEEEKKEEPAPVPKTDRELDAARISVILDVRQVLGNDRVAQETLSCLLMDHDLVRRPDEDLIVPSADSPLWERLPEVPRRNALHRLAAASQVLKEPGPGFVPEFTSEGYAQVRCGRHLFPVADADAQALIRHYKGRGLQELEKRSAAMAHVLALYRCLENPVSSYWQRSGLQLAWDSSLRKRSNVEYELFASPFNTRVENGKYGSRWPHAEAIFGSAGRYPDVIDLFPESAVVGVNPPFSDAYLEHLLGGGMLDRLVGRFKEVHLTVPVREAPWRMQLQRLKGADFVRQFWDATAREERSLGQPVMYWDGKRLLPPTA